MWVRFDNIENINPENDAQIYGIADLHQVRPKLELTSKKPEEVLSEEILEKCNDVEFWRYISENEDAEETSIEEDNNLAQITEDLDITESELIGNWVMTWQCLGFRAIIKSDKQI